MSLEKKHGVDYNQFADTYNFKANVFIYLWITDILQGLVYLKSKNEKREHHHHMKRDVLTSLKVSNPLRAINVNSIKKKWAKDNSRLFMPQLRMKVSFKNTFIIISKNVIQI